MNDSSDDQNSKFSQKNEEEEEEINVEEAKEENDNEMMIYYLSDKIQDIIKELISHNEETKEIFSTDKNTPREIRTILDELKEVYDITSNYALSN